jgi:hypothetical protein
MTCAIDPKAGTHFTGKVSVTQHAIDRAVEHFRIDRSQANNFIIDNLRKAAFVDTVFEDDGRVTRMFGYKRMVFVLDVAEDVVITVFPQHQANASVLDPVQKVLIRALKAAQRKEKAEEKRITVAKAQLAIRRAECEIRKAKTESVKVRALMDAEIAEINAEIAKLDRELAEVKREKKNLCKSIVAYL